MTTKTMLTAIALLLALLLPLKAQGQQFDTYFEDKTLRLDYILAGGSHQAAKTGGDTHSPAFAQEIFFVQAYSSPTWAGRKARLDEVFLQGNGSITLREPGTGRVLYTHSFSTLFQEWLATEEATRVKKAFEVSFNVPFPRRPVDVTLSLTDFHNRETAHLTHTIDPSDILIRSLGPSGILHRYIWQGKTLADGQPDVTDCIDLAIVAEGYTEAQMDKFYADCQRAVDALFAHEPFTSLKERFNVVAVASPSADGGPSIPHDGQWRRTASRTHYDTFYSDRYLMTQEMHRLFDLLAGIAFEHVIVLVNADTYGGGGIYNQLTVTTSDHPTFNQVLVHEFGHAYGGLGDEYFYDDAYESMYPADTEPWEPNLTTLVDFGSKWADLLPEGTPVPTPPRKIPDFRNIKTKKEQALLNAATQRVGVFEGGGYQSKGVYRPAQECRMKINEVEHFCPVCSRALVRITDFYTSR